MTAETIYQNTLLKRFLKTSPPNDLAKLLWQVAGEMVAEKLRLTLPQDIWKRWAGKPMIWMELRSGRSPSAKT